MFKKKTFVNGGGQCPGLDRGKNGHSTGIKRMRHIFFRFMSCSNKNYYLTSEKPLRDSQPNIRVIRNNFNREAFQVEQS